MRPIAYALVALAGTLLATRAFAQITSWSDSLGSSTGRPDVHLTVFGAFAQPEGDFAAMSSTRAGFARRGAGLGLEFSARYQHDIETGAMILVQRNATNTDALGKSIGAYFFANGYPGAAPAVSSTEWTLTWVLVKAGFTPQVGKRARVSVDVYGGVLYGNNPEFKLVASNWSVVHDSRPWVGAAAGAGAGLRWRDHLTIGLLYLSGSAGSWSGFLSSSQPVSTLHATLGYAFGH
jgi:hypothetical protein